MKRPVYVYMSVGGEGRGGVGVSVLGPERCSQSALSSRPGQQGCVALKAHPCSPVSRGARPGAVQSAAAPRHSSLCKAGGACSARPHHSYSRPR